MVDLMRAMLLEAAGRPLRESEVAVPKPGPRQVLLRVLACAVCRTDLHVIDGDLPEPKLPLVPGHEIIGAVVEAGPEAGRWTTGQRVGVPWLGWSCGSGGLCRARRGDLLHPPRVPGGQSGWGFRGHPVAGGAGLI